MRLFLKQLTDSFVLYHSLSSDSKRILSDILKSPGFSSEFFSVGEESTETPGETVRLACFDIGVYRPENITWKVEGEHVLLQGKRSQRNGKGAEGAKFSRAIPIPQGVDPKRITTRYSDIDGQYIVEGVKGKAKPRPRRTNSVYFDETKVSLSVELGSSKAQGLAKAATASNPRMSRLERSASCSPAFFTPTDKIEI